MKTRVKNILSEIWESLKGQERDYTSIKLSKALLLLAVPMVLEMVMESVFAVVDIFFVSKLGAESVAVVGITESVMTIVYSFGFGLSMATTALISRRIGEKDKDKARLTAWQSIVAGVLIALPISIIGLLFSAKILSMMGSTDQMILDHGGYTTIMLVGNFTVILLFIINSIFRSAGDAAIAMKVLWFGNIINIILDPILIFGWWIFPELGVEGAAWATVIGRGMAVFFQLFVLFKGKHIIRLTIQDMKLKFDIIAQLFTKSMGGIFQNLIATSSWILLYRIISHYEAAALAGYTIAIRLIIFFMLPSWGLANAASTLVGQNLGAKQPARAERSVWLAAKANFVLLGLIGLSMALFPGVYISIFDTAPDVHLHAVNALRIVGSGFAFYALGMVMIQSHNGAGDTFTPTWIYAISFWAIEIPLAYVLSIKIMDRVEGVYLAIVIAESLMSVIALLVFRRGRWKRVEV